MYDIIGDIHGFSDALNALLIKLGYSNRCGYFEHPERKVIFTGDFIDRGPKVRDTLEIVSSMIDKGTAYSVLGNHEYNAICYHFKDSKGNFLREHSEKNEYQYSQTLKSFENHYSELKSYIRWFTKLPIFFEIPGLRVIHACWDFQLIEFIKASLPSKKINREFLMDSAWEGTLAHEAIDVLLKGRELKLPNNCVSIDPTGIPRKSVRVKWWVQFGKETYRSVAVNYEKTVPETVIKKNLINNFTPYLSGHPPVFVGHYWRKGKPDILTNNVCCVDFSIAKGGKLVAYRWDGEQKLNPDKFIYIE